jgi:hypothetical protein
MSDDHYDFAEGLPNLTNYSALNYERPSHNYLPSTSAPRAVGAQIQTIVPPPPVIAEEAEQQPAAATGVPTAPPGAPFQLRSDTVESWRLGLTASDVRAVFWDRVRPTYYLYPTTQSGKKFRQDRLALGTGRVPGKQLMLPFCQLYSVDQKEDLSELASADQYKPWLRAFTDLNVERFYCELCNPTLPDCGDTGVLNHVALACRTDVLLHERCSLHQRKLQQMQVESSNPVARHLAVRLCDVALLMLAEFRQLIPPVDGDTRGRKRGRVETGPLASLCTGAPPAGSVSD